MESVFNEAQPRVFSAEHFASVYERYAALLLSRVPRIGKAAVAHLFCDGERRDFLALPRRAADAGYHRLDSGEIAPLLNVLAERERELCAMGAFDAPVFRNVEVLGGPLCLSTVERALLALAVIVESVRPLRDAIERLARHLRDRPALVRALAALLDCDNAALLAALHPEGTLTRSGLVTLDLQDEDGLLLRARHGLVEVLFDAYDEGATRDTRDASHALFARFTAPARAPQLSLDDFAHITADRDLLVNLLARAAQQREAGIHVMLYGAPGTGKTELARVVAASASLSLHEVRHTDEGGGDMRHTRYSQVIVAQQLLSPVSGAVLLFDETEDLLPADHAAPARTLGKAAFNHLLETNPVPMIWVSNEIRQIDPAYLRRFAFILEVKRPNQAVRRRIAARAFGGLSMGEAWLDRIAGIEDATPGQVTQAGRVARLLTGQAPGAAAAAAERVLINGMRALGQRNRGAQAAQARFDLSLLNCGVDVEALVSNIAQRPAARLAFYGPPGTGKSALARHIALAAGRPLLVKRASDLLSPWLGECEQNIARAFEQAADEGALLLLDEADSFLGDRRDARARWEITESNELLTQMDQFDGLFVCTTNLMERLDRAALRRFSLKLRFDYLRPQQVCRMLSASLGALASPPARETDLAEASRLLCATPGDFAAVEQRFRLLGEAPHPQQFIAALREELAFKQESGVQRIGF